MKRATVARLGLLVAILITLAGCASTVTAPGVVKEAVAEPCKSDLPPRPVMPVESVALDADVWTLGTALWAERQIREAYEIALATRLKGCIEQTDSRK